MRDIADEVLHRAAFDADLGDDEFVMIARAVEGKDPLTGERGSPPAQYQFLVDVDYDDEPHVWLGTGEDDPNPVAVISKRELDAAHPALWPALLRGLDLGDGA